MTTCRLFRVLLLPLCLAAALLLSGCSMLAFWMTPDWVEDADLIVVNQNEVPVYAITLQRPEGAESVSRADGFALLERGESYGLYLEGAEDELTVVLSDELGRSLARFPVDFHGERLVLALEEDGTATVQPEGPLSEGGEGA